jgi:hypothetical protein
MAGWPVCWFPTSSDFCCGGIVGGALTLTGTLPAGLPFSSSTSLRGRRAIRSSAASGPTSVSPFAMTTVALPLASCGCWRLPMSSTGAKFVWHVNSSSPSTRFRFSLAHLVARHPAVLHGLRIELCAGRGVSAQQSFEVEAQEVTAPVARGE